MAFKKQATPQQAPYILAQKKNRLDQYNAQFDRAVSLVTNTIDELGKISQNISETMGEIDEYERELAATKSGLAEAKAKNDKVISNFKSLLAVE